MGYSVERRQRWNRIIGLERRGAPVDSLQGQPLPDPTRLVDEEFRGPRVPPARPTPHTWAQKESTGVHFVERSRQRKTLAGIEGLSFLKRWF